MQTARLDGVGSLLCLPTASLHKLLSGLLRGLVFPPHNCLSFSRTPQKQSNITPAQSSWVLLIFDQVQLWHHKDLGISVKNKVRPQWLERQCSAVISSLGSLDEAGYSERASVGCVNGKKSWGTPREKERGCLWATCGIKMFTFLYNFNELLQPLISYKGVLAGNYV